MLLQVAIDISLVMPNTKHRFHWIKKFSKKKTILWLVTYTLHIAAFQMKSKCTINTNVLYQQIYQSTLGVKITEPNAIVLQKIKLSVAKTEEKESGTETENEQRTRVSVNSCIQWRTDRQQTHNFHCYQSPWILCISKHTNTLHTKVHSCIGSCHCALQQCGILIFYLILY